MSNRDRQRPGERPNRRKPKHSKKATQQVTSESTAASEPGETVFTPAQSIETVTALEAPPAERVERTASFKERMASVMPLAETTTGERASPVEVAPVASSAMAAPAAGIQAIANAYRDYTRKSFEDAQSFAVKFTAARSLDKAVEAQTEFARQACETFADNSRKIRTLYRELFWQSLQFPKWPPREAQR